MLKHALIAIVILGSTGCSAPPVTEIGSGWFVDETKAPWAHLYHVADGKRVVVDRLIYSYRLYYKVCLAYESSRSYGQVMFLVAGNRTPYPVAVSDTRRPWRIDADGLRRFETREDETGRRLLAIEFIGFSDLCTAAQMAAPFEDNWAESTWVVDGKAKIVESVLDVNGGDSVGNSTLSEAVRVGQITVIDELLRAGADINSANRHGGTPLMTAVYSRKTDLVRQLLAGGARINAQNDDGQTALMAAARMRNPEMAELLLDAGADMTIRDDLGRNAAAHLPDGGNPGMDKLRARFTRAAQ